MKQPLRIGIDLGGTKIEGIAMAANSSLFARRRVDTPQGDYPATLQEIAAMVAELEAEVGAAHLNVGICTPGSISPFSGLIRNANSQCLNGKPLQQDLEQLLGRQLRLANDADCLAVSEAADGAAAGRASVFAVILGTGVGGGVVVDGRLLAGANAIAGEWGHNPLPWPRSSETPGPACWCGLQGCIETWLSGPALEREYQAQTGQTLSAAEIEQVAAQNEPAALETLGQYEDRLGRALAAVINLLDPEVIVLGGGLSNLERLYENVPALWGDYVFSERVQTRLVKARHGDASGVRGAAWLWPT